MILLVLRAHDVAQHAIRFAHRLDDELLHCARELLVPVHAQQAPVHNLAVILSPVATLLELGPVPARDTLTRQALKNEQLARLLVLDEHAHVVVVGASHPANQLVLHLFAGEE